jgi:hypothetical protein
LKPAPLNVVTPVSLRSSAPICMSMDPVGPPRPVSRPAPQPKRGSAITGAAHTNATSVTVPTGSGNVALCAASVTRVLTSPRISRRALAPCTGMPATVNSRTSSTMASTAEAACARHIRSKEDKSRCMGLDCSASAQRAWEPGALSQIGNHPVISLPYPRRRLPVHG